MGWVKDELGDQQCLEMQKFYDTMKGQIQSIAQSKAKAKTMEDKKKSDLSLVMMLELFQN